MTLNEYQEQAMTTCTDTSRNFAYMMLNLVGEVGEFASKVAKAIRKEQMQIGNDLCGQSNADENQLIFAQDDDEGYNQLKHELESALRKEAGDILWQLQGLCTVMGWTLEEVAEENLAKLADRKKRDTIVGEGDER